MLHSHHGFFAVPDMGKERSQDTYRTFRDRRVSLCRLAMLREAVLELHWIRMMSDAAFGYTVVVSTFIQQHDLTGFSMAQVYSIKGQATPETTTIKTFSVVLPRRSVPKPGRPVFRRLVYPTPPIQMVEQAGTAL